MIWVMRNARNCGQHPMQMWSLGINFGWSWISLAPWQWWYQSSCLAIPDSFILRYLLLWLSLLFSWSLIIDHSCCQNLDQDHDALNDELQFICTMTMTMFLILSCRTKYNTLVIIYCFYLLKIKTKSVLIFLIKINYDEFWDWWLPLWWLRWSSKHLKWKITQSESNNNVPDIVYLVTSHANFKLVIYCNSNVIPCWNSMLIVWLGWLVIQTLLTCGYYSMRRIKKENLG